MPERPKPKKTGTTAEDQKERGYYYDDAHGYEAYDPDADDGDENPTDIDLLPEPGPSPPPSHDPEAEN